VLIKDNQNVHGLSVQPSAEKYGISKSSAVNIIHRREEYLSDYTSNSNNGIKRKHKDEDGNKIDELVFERFALQRAKCIPISEPFLQEKVKQFAARLGYQLDEFQASNGRLKIFCARHAISFRVISGETTSVNNATVEEWNKQLSTILEGYGENNLFNVDETGFFYHTLPDPSLVLKIKECKVGKKSKVRFTVLFCSN
jgi:hypothetical protein